MAETKKKLGKKGQVIHSQTREMILHVANFMKAEASNGAPLQPVANFHKRTLQATGISESSYRRIVNKEGPAVAAGTSKYVSPRKTLNKPSTKSELPSHETEEVRRLVNDFYLQEKRPPTIRQINMKLQECDVAFDGCDTTLRTLLRKMGFRFRKTQDKRKVLMESYTIRNLRTTYLKAIKRFRAEGRPIVYADETFIHSSQTDPTEWSDGSLNALKAPVAKGKGLVIVHAGSAEGFIPNNGLWMVRSGCKTGDLMNADDFHRWLNTQLMPNLPPRAVLVLDDAPYHCVKAEKEPKTASKRQEMCDWLSARNITYDDLMTKPELYAIIKAHKTQHPAYTIDTILAEHGVTVLRLPPYHPELNPIEKVWALVKNWVAQRNTTCKLDDVERLTREKLASVTSQQWKNICAHVGQIEDGYLEQEVDMDAVSEVLLDLAEDSSDSDGILIDSDEETL